jgi:hypothetical protein
LPGFCASGSSFVAGGTGVFEAPFAAKETPITISATTTALRIKNVPDMRLSWALIMQARSTQMQFALKGHGCNGSLH